MKALKILSMATGAVLLAAFLAFAASGALETDANRVPVQGGVDANGRARSMLVDTSGRPILSPTSPDPYVATYYGAATTTVPNTRRTYAIDLGGIVSSAVIHADAPTALRLGSATGNLVFIPRAGKLSTAPVGGFRYLYVCTDSAVTGCPGGAVNVTVPIAPAVP